MDKYIKITQFDVGREFPTEEYVASLKAENEAARAIMEKFVNKVETGRARSKETYAEMKEWLC
jgi:hypothetical protein